MGETPLRVLVVDDEPSVLEVTTIELEDYGFDCEAAIDGAQALRLLDMSRFDAVVTDLCMPTMHGHALAVELLSRPNRPVVVVVTAVEEPRMADDLLTRGIEDIFIKPVHHGLLAVKLKALIKRRRSVVAGIGDF